MKPSHIALVLAFSLTISACASSSNVVTDPTESLPTPVAYTRTPVPMAEATEAQSTQPVESTGSGLPELTDNQGAVTVIVKPLDLREQDQQLKFEVALNTHSVDLSMDLAALSTLATDTGLTVQASAWDAPRGGHHVSGVLSFPSRAEGIALLEDASTLTLVIKDVDVPERSFAWDIK